CRAARRSAQTGLCRNCATSRLGRSRYSGFVGAWSMSDDILGMTTSSLCQRGRSPRDTGGNDDGCSACRGFPAMRLAVWVRYWTALALMLLVAPQRPVFASPPECPDAGACLFEIEGPSDRAAATTTEPASRPLSLRFFWGVGCPHCEHAKSFVAELERSDASLHVERWEVRQSEEGRRRFVATMRRLGAEAVGIPTFVVERQYVVGFQRGTTEAQVRRMIDAARSGGGAPDAAHTIDLPLVGEVNAQAMSLPALTIVVGLLDGINPCAIWVLLVLLGILMHVRSRPRLLLFGGTFVLMSGVVYFAFMTAWSWFFELAGLSRVITVGLGIAVTLM